MTAVLAVRTHGSLVARLLRREGWSHAELLGSSLDEGLRAGLNNESMNDRSELFDARMN